MTIDLNEYKRCSKQLESDLYDFFNNKVINISTHTQVRDYNKNEFENDPSISSMHLDQKFRTIELYLKSFP